MIRTALIGKSEKSVQYAGVIGHIEGCVPAVIWEGSSMITGAGNVQRSVVAEGEQVLISEMADAVIFTSEEAQTSDMIRDFLKNGRHVLMYPDPKIPWHQLENLRRIAEEAGVLLFMAHRIHDANLSKRYRKYCSKPEFISIYRHFKRHAFANSRFIRETLYYEIIALLSLNRVSLRKYALMSVPFNSPDPFLITVRIEFVNGSSAFLTLNQYSDYDERTVEMFSSDTMVKSDSRTGNIEVKKSDRSDIIFHEVKNAELPDINISEDITCFFQLIGQNSFPADPYISGIMTHKTATEILDQLSTVPG